MKKVITYGTFDLFHHGHYNILKRAKELGDYLIVGVTSESYDLERGKLNVKDSLITRINNVKATGFADEIIIEEYQGQKIHDVNKYEIDILVVGSDWIGKFDYLNKYCKVIYLDRTKNISSTQIREENRIYNVGLIIDDKCDDNIIEESKYVSGIHMEGVYGESEDSSKQFCDQFQLNFYTNDFEEFLKKIDIVCINTKSLNEEKYFSYMKQAILQGKHVICNLAYISDEKKIKYLFELAEQRKVLICENVIIAYLKAFDQLLWFINGNIIGDLVSLNFSISKNNFDKKLVDIREIIYEIIFVIQRIVGDKVKRILSFKAINGRYESFYVFTDSIEITARIGVDIDLEDCMEIVGTEGRVYIPSEWWKMQYFKIRKNKSNKVQRYSYNFEGTGFRYIMMDLLSMLEAGRNESCKIFSIESLRTCRLIHSFMPTEEN